MTMLEFTDACSSALCSDSELLAYYDSGIAELQCASSNSRVKQIAIFGS